MAAGAAEEAEEAEEGLNIRRKMNKSTEMPRLIRQIASAEREKNWSMLAKLCKQAVNAGVDREIIWKTYGKALVALHKFRDAESAIRNWERINPDGANLHLLLGLVCYELKNYEEAIIQLEEQRKITPNDAGLLRSLGLSYSFTADFLAAASVFKNVLQINDVDDANFGDHINLGNAYFGLEDWAGAQIEYALAVQCNPDDAIAHLALAQAYYNRHRHDDAIGECRTSLELDPYFLKTYGLLMLALFYSARWVEVGVVFCRWLLAIVNMLLLGKRSRSQLP